MVDIILTTNMIDVNISTVEPMLKNFSSKFKKAMILELKNKTIKNRLIPIVV